MTNQKLLEAVSDISFIAGEKNFFSGNSREDVYTFIQWAKEFVKENSKTYWHEVDYIESITKFTENKLSAFLGELS